jgi:hypothetical protein
VKDRFNRCTGCGKRVGFLKLTWIKWGDFFFCKLCIDAFGTYMQTNRLTVLSGILRTRKEGIKVSG